MPFKQKYGKDEAMQRSKGRVNWKGKGSELLMFESSSWQATGEIGADWLYMRWERQTN